MRLVFAAAVACGLLSSSGAGAQSFQAACRIHALCPGVERGGGRVIACLREHKANLSTTCKLAIADFFLNRQGRGGAQNEEGPARGRFGRGDAENGADARDAGEGPGAYDREAVPRARPDMDEPRDRPHRYDAPDADAPAADARRLQPRPDPRDLPPDDPDQAPLPPR